MPLLNRRGVVGCYNSRLSMKNSRQVNNRKELLKFRKQLRNHGTPAEATLWNSLNGRQVEGRKFRRQFSVENYILDFYCPSARHRTRWRILPLPA